MLGLEEGDVSVTNNKRRNPVEGGEDGSLLRL